MTSTIDPTEESHLEGLLQAARDDLNAGAPWRQRTAAFLVVDYHQAVLVAAARTVRRELRGGMGLEAMNVIFAALPDIPREEVGRIEGLREIRNKLDHYPEWLPGERVVASYLERAEDTRSRIVSGAVRARERLDSMSEIPRMFAELLIAARSIEPAWLPDDGEFADLLRQVERVADGVDAHVGAEEIQAYADVSAALQIASDNRDAYYEDMAMTSAAEAYNGD